jgi:hypothetical protein
VATIDHIDQLVYQCDECLVPGEVLGVKMDVALTFTVDAAGTIVVASGPLPE